MAPSQHQVLVDEFHREVAEGHHGHNMHDFHRRWHAENRDPTPPTERDPDWGVDIRFGEDFLVMHHEMVRLPSGEHGRVMHHPSILAWYEANGHRPPSPWDPMSVIPSDLGYDPDPSVFPADIEQALRDEAGRRGVAVEELLRRSTDQPQFRLPGWATLEGIGPDEEPERYTGARRLSDFKNVNQLGCCIVFPHNRWHVAIGGAMSSTWTAIADPIFYWGVHWHIDLVFEAYRQLTPADVERLEPMAVPPAPTAFSAEDHQERDLDLRLSARLLGLPGA